MSKSLKQVLREHIKDATSIVRLSCAGLGTMIIENTPRKTGSARASWNASIGEPKPNNIYIFGDNPTQARNNLTAVVNSLQVGQTFSFANGQPYIRELEYGSSPQAAAGQMVRANVAQWDDMVNEIARSQRNGI